MQDIAIYNRALTPAEIQSHYTKRLEGAPFSGLVSTDQLVSLWDFDADFQDKVGTNHLTNVNGVTRVPGKLGNAASFNGVNQYLSCASNASLQTGDTDFTFAAWVYPGTFTGSILGKDHSSSREYTFDIAASQNIRFFINGGALITEKQGFLNAWQLVLVWHDAAANTLNIQSNNGSVSSVSTGGLAPAIGSAEFRVGAIAYPGVEGYFNGLIDQPLLFKRILSAAERTAMWNSGNGLRY